MSVPFQRMLVEECHRAGVKAIMWFLGDCMPLLRDIRALGFDALWVEQGRRGHSSDLSVMRGEMGSEFCLFGWVWEYDLVRDRRESIRQTVRQQISEAGRDGAFVAATRYLTRETDPSTMDFACEEVIGR